MVRRTPIATPTFVAPPRRLQALQRSARPLPASAGRGVIMHRVVARLPESVAELCLVRLGIQVKGLSAWLFARRLRSAIEADARRAMAEEVGLLNSESFAIGITTSGSCSTGEASTTSTPGRAGRRTRSGGERPSSGCGLKKDFGVSHETFLVRSSDLESIYLDCRPTGLAAFGVLGEPVGPMTTSRGRLGRNRSRPGPGSSLTHKPCPLAPEPPPTPPW